MTVSVCSCRKKTNEQYKDLIDALPEPVVKKKDKKRVLKSENT